MKLLKHNHFVKIILGVVAFLFLFYFLNKMFEKTSSVEGFCPPNQYLNKEFNKCCVRENWYAPTRDTCVIQDQGSCPKGQYMNDKFNQCCDKDKYYHSGAKKCVNMK